MDIYQRRRQNLLRLIEAEFNGNQTAFAGKTGVKPPQVNRWVSETANDKRNITERSARKIEYACGKSDGWLDAADLVEPTPQLVHDSGLEMLTRAWTVAGIHARAEGLTWARAVLATRKDHYKK